MAPQSSSSSKKWRIPSLMMHNSLVSAGAAVLLLAGLVLHAPGVASAAPTKLDMHAGHQLTPDNFQESIRDGIWLVEHYSPFCHHCKAFVPTWKELVESRQHQEDTINFHFGQVDCAVYGDLCDKNNVKGYPSLFLFENGEYVETFKKERSMERMNKWLDDRLPDDPSTTANSTGSTPVQPGSGIDDDTAEDPAPIPALDDAAIILSSAAQSTANTGAIEHNLKDTLATTAAEPISSKMRTVDETEGQGSPFLQVQQLHTLHHKRVTPNPEGEVKHLNTPELEELLDPNSTRGPVFVKYYAPWCGFCKKLLPTWKELASKLKGRVNVVEFNCDASENKAKCRSEGITGYPTLVFYQGGEKAEYRGGRSLSQFETFANKAVLSTGMRDISISELKDISQEDEVFFLYLFPSNTPPSEIDLVQTAASTLLGSAPVFKTSQSDLFAHFNYPETHPSLLVFKDHELTPSDSLNFTNVHSTSTSVDRQESQKKEAEVEIAKWIHGKKLPSLDEFTSLNFGDYMEKGQSRVKSYVAIAALSPTTLGEDRTKRYQDELRQTAKAWQGAMKTINPDAKPVHFVWVDADKWSKYLSSTYGIKPNRPEPLLVLVDPTQEIFYPVDANKQSVRIDQAQIFQALEDLYDGKLKGIKTTSRAERAGRWILHYFDFLGLFIGNHPFWSAIIGIVGFATCFVLLVYYFDNEELRNRGKPQASLRPQPKFVPSERSLYSESYNSGPGVKKD